MKSLPFALDEEFKRVAKEEGISMGDLVEEVAEHLECTPRMIYNYRSGKWPLPEKYVSPLCRRFKSELLLAVWDNQNDETPAPVIDAADIDPTKIKEQAKDLVLTALEHYHLIESAVMKAGGLLKTDITEIEESNGRVTLRFKNVLLLVGALYEQQMGLKRKQA